MELRQLTIAQACASSNIWFKVESAEQQRMFQEEFFRQGGVDDDGKQVVEKELGTYLCIDIRKVLWVLNNYSSVEEHEQVQIIWHEEEEEPSIVIDCLAPEVTLKVTLNPTVPYDDFIRLLQQIEHETLVKDFISDKCLRKLPDSQLASLARLLVEKRAALENYPAEHTEEADIIKGFVLSAVKHKKTNTSKTRYWYNFYRKDVEHLVRYSQAGLYQEELKNSPEWEALSWERRGEE